MWYPPKERTQKIDAELENLEGAAASEEFRSSSFLVSVSAAVRQLAVGRTIAQAQLRDWIWIGSQYRLNSGKRNRASAISLRALLFLAKHVGKTDATPEELRRDLNWVTDSTISELIGELGANATNRFMSQEETALVESRLETLTLNSLPLNPEERVRLEEYLTLFRDVASEVYLPGIAELVTKIATHAESDSINQVLATACLRYVLEEDDVVSDSLGYLGLVDDIHALELTYRRLEQRSTWQPVVDSLNSRYPYLTRVSFAESDGVVRLSPYMQAIFGAGTGELGQAGTRACLVLPETRICGLIASFLAALESIRRQTDLDQESLEFRPGDDIFFGDAAADIRARYHGVLEVAGQNFHMIELRNGRQNIAEHLLRQARKAASPHARLSKQEDFQEWKRTHSPSPLTFLVGGEFKLKDVRPEVLFLTKRHRLDALLPEVKPMGQTISDLVGIKYISSRGNEENLSRSSGREPLIWACSDVVTAKELLRSREQGFNPRFIISDEPEQAFDLDAATAGDGDTNAYSHLVFAPLHAMEAVQQLAKQNFNIWFLKQSDVFLVPNREINRRALSAGAVSRFQRRQEIQSHVVTEIRDVQSDPIEFLHEYQREFRKASRNGGDPHLELLAASIGVFLRRFTRFPLEFGEFEKDELRKLLKAVASQAAVLADYNADVSGFLGHNKSLLEGDLPENPKAAMLESIIRDHPYADIAVACPSSQVAALAEQRTQACPVLGRARWLSALEVRRNAPFGRVIVPGWIDKHTMREFRNNGYAEHIDLLLYGFEKEWEAKSRKALKSWEGRLTRTMRTQWVEAKERFGDIEEPAFIADSREEPGSIDGGLESEPDTDLYDVKFIDAIRRSTQENRAGQPIVKARLVTFDEPGTYIYLPPNGSVISLSRAIGAVGGSIEGKMAERLIRCPVEEIGPGDLLAFPMDSKSDLLSTLAERFLRDSGETIRSADLWREALRRYLGRTGKNETALQRELEKAGLKRHPFTIRLWIAGMDIVAPLQYAEAVPIIAEVTRDEELMSVKEKVIEAIDMVYQARWMAAGELLRQLARQDIVFSEGLASVTIEGFNVQYRLMRVGVIDPPTLVPQDYVGVLSNISDLMVA